MDSPFDGGFLARASTFPRSDYPRSSQILRRTASLPHEQESTGSFTWSDS